MALGAAVVVRSSPFPLALVVEGLSEIPPGEEEKGRGFGGVLLVGLLCPVRNCDCHQGSRKVRLLVHVPGAPRR